MKKVFTAIILLGLASGISGCQTVSKMSSKLWHKDSQSASASAATPAAAPAAPAAAAK
jgi:hypothetical protein